MESLGRFDAGPRFAAEGDAAVIGDKEGVVHVAALSGRSPRLLLRHK